VPRTHPPIAQTGRRRQCPTLSTHVKEKAHIHPPIAQLVEQLPFKEKVLGSIPSGRTREKTAPACCFFILVRSGVMFLVFIIQKQTSWDRKYLVHLCTLVTCDDTHDCTGRLCVRDRRPCEVVSE